MEAKAQGRGITFMYSFRGSKYHKINLLQIVLEYFSFSFKYIQKKNIWSSKFELEFGKNNAISQQADEI